METMLFMGALGAIIWVLYQSNFVTPKAPEKSKIKPESALKSAPEPVQKSEPEPEPKATKKAAVKKTTSKAEDPEKPSHKLKNPETGEAVTVPGSYRFVKRWIKEALVKEGLLDKIYKNNELNDDNKVIIKTAIIGLKGIKKYQV